MTGPRVRPLVRRRPGPRGTPRAPTDRRSDGLPRSGEIDDIAWYADNSGGRVHDVGGKAPNPWGLHYMLGNVWEWCWDLYDEEVYGVMRSGDRARTCCGLRDADRPDG